MWKDIKGYEGLYQVSDKGEVRRITKKGYRLLKQSINKPSNYPSVALSKEGKQKTKTVHRIVAETFLELPSQDYEVNHKDGNKTNNSVSNLEWVTQKANIDHANYVIDHPVFGKKPRGVKCIDLETGEIIATFPSVSTAASAVKRPYARVGITFCCQGKYNTAYGYKWEYAD